MIANAAVHDARTRAATHEAGHIAAAVWSGLRVRRATISADGSGRTAIDAGPDAATLFVALAGDAAERTLLTAPPPDGDSGYAGDRVIAETAAVRYAGPRNAAGWIALARTRAAGFVLRNAAVIRTLAAALAERRTLEGDDALRIVAVRLRV